VTDSSSWQPPTPYGPPVTRQNRQFAAPTGTPGWTPPPRPGLIPLRPLTLGTLLSAAFQVLRRNPRPTFGFALLVNGGITLLTLIVVGAVTFFAVSRTLNATEADAATLGAGSVALIILSGLIPVALSIVASAVVQGVISLEVARATLGEKLKLSGLWRAARGRIGALIGWTLLITGAVIVALTVVSVVIALIIAFGGTAGIVIGVLLGVVFVTGAIVASVWLSTRLSLVPSVLMLERLPLRAAVVRSWSLTTGYFWKTLGIQLLVVVIVQTVAGIISAPLQLILGFASALFNPASDQTAFAVGIAVVYVLTIAVSIVFGAIAQVVQASTAALIYIDLRMRKEGLDLQLSHFVEARGAGDPTVPDPYFVGPTAPLGTGTGSTSLGDGPAWS